MRRIVLVHGSVVGGRRRGASSGAASATGPSSSCSSGPASRPAGARSRCLGRHLSTLRRVDFEGRVWVAERLEDGDHLVGHSYGGVIALLAAAAAGNRLASLTVIEPPCTRVALDDPAVAAFAPGGAELYANGPQLEPEAFLRMFLGAVGSDFDPPVPLPPAARAGRARC